MTATIGEHETAAIAPPSRLPDAATVGALYVVSIVGALALSALLVAATGGSWTKVFSALIDGSIRNDGAWGDTLTRMAPLLLVATGAIVSTRAGLVNIGQEGQLLVGAVFAAYLGNHMSGPGPLVIVCALAFGALGGALWAGIAAALRFGRGVPEVLSTLLLVFVAFPLLAYGLRSKSLLLDTDPTVRQQLNTGTRLPADRRLPRFGLFGNEFHLGVVIALVVVVVGGFVLARTVWGFRLRMLGLNPQTAQRMGVAAAAVGTVALLVSGALAGVAGGVLLAGTPDYRITVGFSRNFGWDGLLVALLARNRPFLVIPMAFIFAGLRTGSDYLAATGVASDIVDVVQALLVLALLIPPAVLFVRDRRRAIAAAHGGRDLVAFFSAIFDIFGSSTLYGSTTRLAVFLALAATGEWVAERGGTLNISVEGMCLVAAFSAVAGSDITNSVLGGIFFGVASAMIIAAVQGNLSHRLTANQFVVGLAINVFALGLTSFLWQELDLDAAAASQLPGADHLPGVLRQIFDQRWTAYLVVPAVAACWWLVFRTRWGLEVRAVGENPQAADVSGIHVNRRRREAILVCGAMCGLAGSYLSLDTVGFSPNMTSGRGFIAIAAVIFGGWTLRGALAGCVLFGGVEAFTIVVQSLELDVNRQFLQALPYLVTLVVMAVFAKRTRQPQSLARPFVRGLT